MLIALVLLLFSYFETGQNVVIAYVYGVPIFAEQYA